MLTYTDSITAVTNSQRRNMQCPRPPPVRTPTFSLYPLLLLHLRIPQSTTQMTWMLPPLLLNSRLQLLTSAWQRRKTASLLKCQEEFRESPCELFKQELEQDSPTHSWAFSDKHYLLNARKWSGSHLNCKAKWRYHELLTVLQLCRELLLLLFFF